MADAVTSFFHASRNSRTFRQAAESYLQNGGEGRYLGPIIDYFYDTPVEDITPFAINEMVKGLYPEHQNSTRNRQGITPARAVMSSSVFIETYVHSKNAGRLVADRFNAFQFSVEL